MTRLVPFSVVLIAVLASGAAAGFCAGRWGNSRTVQSAVARLDRVPLALGTHWDVQEDSPLSEREVAVAEVDGYLSRRYIHRRTGTIVSALLLCGRPGPISVHTPEVCYAGVGFEEIGSAKAYTPPTNSHCQFQVRDFQKSNVANPILLRVFLSWGHKGEWSVPANPRLAFAGNPYLYKLYVVREMTKANEPVEQDLATELIKDLIPQLQEKLFGDN
jgi:hypothetical protein